MFYSLFLGDEFGRLCEGMIVSDMAGGVLAVVVAVIALLWRTSSQWCLNKSSDRERNDIRRCTSYEPGQRYSSCFYWGTQESGRWCWYQGLDAVLDKAVHPKHGKRVKDRCIREGCYWFQRVFVGRFWFGVDLLSCAILTAIDAVLLHFFPSSWKMAKGWITSYFWTKTSCSSAVITMPISCGVFQVFLW